MNAVPVKTFDSYITANIWLGKLRDVGIRCYLKDEYTVTIDPILSNAIGGIKLCVDAAQVNEAGQLIHDFETQSRMRQRCPQCHSFNVSYISKAGPTNWLSAITTWLLGSYAVSAQQVYHCNDCGDERAELENEELDAIAEN